MSPITRSADPDPYMTLEKKEQIRSDKIIIQVILSQYFFLKIYKICFYSHFIFM